ncbi:MAG: type VI secretion system tube protein Hcp [Actinobacteria bacterium]|nr:type VI secretion system tube protein Hcp [Actinomycetota bacterium]
MALNAYLTLKGQRQGVIKGSVTQKGREGTILVRGASHEIVSPRDPASGQATGKRVHKPFVITKEVDRATPLLYQALVTNEVFLEWTLRLTRATLQSTEQQHYTVKLLNASIASISFRLPDNQVPDLARVVEYEEISFVYPKIEWTWSDGGITAIDDWMTSNP